MSMSDKMERIAAMLDETLEAMEAGCGDYDIDRHLAADVRWIKPCVQYYRDQLHWMRSYEAYEAANPNG